MIPEDTLKSYIQNLEDNIRTIVEENKNELKNDVLGFLFAKSKRIRPIFIYFCTHILGGRVDDDIQNTALALELIHSATLVHDDVLDESEMRREDVSFYSKFGSKKSIILGDYLLSLALLALSKLNNPKILKIFSQNVLKTLNGEINQFEGRFNIANEEQCLEKTAAKTASLFVCGAECVCELLGADAAHRNALKNFAYDFGTYFQLKNDIKNFLSGEDDIKNGVYTLPLIYFKQENPECDIINIDRNQIVNYAKKTDDKARKIIKNALLNIESIKGAHQMLAGLIKLLEEK